MEENRWRRRLFALGLSPLTWPAVLAVLIGSADSITGQEFHPAPLRLNTTRAMRPVAYQDKADAAKPPALKPTPNFNAAKTPSAPTNTTGPVTPSADAAGPPENPMGMAPPVGHVVDQNNTCPLFYRRRPVGTKREKKQIMLENHRLEPDWYKFYRCEQYGYYPSLWRPFPPDTSCCSVNNAGPHPYDLRPPALRRTDEDDQEAADAEADLDRPPVRRPLSTPLSNARQTPRFR